MSRFQVCTVLAHESHVHGKAAAHRFGDALFHTGLRHARLRPVTLDHLAAVLHFNERAPFLVTGAPQCSERGAGLHCPTRRRDDLRDLDVEPIRLRIEHGQGQDGRHGFAKAVGRFEHGAVRAGRQRERLAHDAAGVGRKRLLGDQLTQRPCVDIRKVGIDRAWRHLRRLHPSPAQNTPTKGTWPAADDARGLVV